MDYVYLWADGIHLNVRLDEEKLCLLVMIGVRVDGTKELIALADGYRESTGSWADLLRDCKRRGMRAPVLAVGDGALGFWAALREVFPETREQRCWFHKIANVLAALPKSAHPGAKKALAEIWNAEDRDHARRAVAAFKLAYGAKFAKAVAKITDDLDELLAFYDYPAEHWIHLRTTNPIESTFATVRHRTKVTKGPGSKAAGLAMASDAQGVGMKPAGLRGRVTSAAAAATGPAAAGRRAVSADAAGAEPGDRADEGTIDRPYDGGREPRVAFLLPHAGPRMRTGEHGVRVDVARLAGVHLDRAQVLGADEPVLTRAHQPYRRTMGRAERLPVQAGGDEHVLGKCVLEQDDRAVSVPPPEHDVRDRRGGSQLGLDQRAVEGGESNTLPPQSGCRPAGDAMEVGHPLDPRQTLEFDQRDGQRGPDRPGDVKGRVRRDGRRWVVQMGAEARKAVHLSLSRWQQCHVCIVSGRRSARTPPPGDPPPPPEWIERSRPPGAITPASSMAMKERPNSVPGTHRVFGTLARPSESTPTADSSRSLRQVGKEMPGPACRPG